jgi:SapC
MKIEAPLGYEQITPLRKNHKVVLPRMGEEAPAVFHRLHSMPISLTEFGPASRDYPIVFVSDDGSKTFNAAVILGLQSMQNLFILTDGTWDRRVYLPAYVRRYPFCMAKLDGDAQKERVVCVEASSVQDGGEPLYDEAGNTLPQWHALEKLIFDYESDLLRAEELCKLLARLELLEPFTMKAEVEGFTMQLEGMHRVARNALDSLTDDKLRQLLVAGMLEKVYSHLLSLDNFRRLLNRATSTSPVCPATVGPCKQCNAGEDHGQAQPLTHRHSHCQQSQETIRLAREFDQKSQRPVTNQEHPGHRADRPPAPREPPQQREQHQSL